MWTTLPSFATLLGAALLSAVQSEHLSEVYDITTIYKLQRAPSGATTLEFGEVIARTNARGMPLRRGMTSLNGASDEKCCSDWENDGWRKLNVKEAQETTPILDPSLRNSPQADGMHQSEDGSWRGELLRGQMLRVDWTPERRGAGFLSALLCDTPFPRNCYGLTLSGHADGRLRYYWARYGPDGKQGPFWVPGGGQTTLRSTIEAKDEAVREDWVPVRRYTLQLERTPADQLQVVLEGGDAAQERERLFDMQNPDLFTYLFIDRFKKDGTVLVQGDPAWRGSVDTGREVPLTWTPGPTPGSALGVFLCTSARQDTCHGAVISGSDGRRLRIAWARYGSAEATPAAWLPGRAERLARSTVLSTEHHELPEVWNATEYNMTLSLQGWRATLKLDGGVEGDASTTSSWELPPGHNYVVIASFKSRGLVQVRAAAGSLSSAGPPIAWPVWALDYGRTEGSLTGPAFPAPPHHQLCVVLGARVPADGRLQLGFKGAGQRQVRPVFTIEPGASDNGWVQMRSVVDLPLELVRRSDKIQLVLNATTSSDETVLVQVADVCNALGDHDLTTFVSEAVPISKLFGFDIASSSAAEPFKGKTGPCKHGGVLDLVAARCRCPPGFKGRTCEIGCGNNQIGADCDETCSDDTRDGCQGLLVCGPGLPCTCAPGFKGTTCDRLCPETKYGPNCKFTCGRCYNGSPCDRYSGRCTKGCAAGFQPPLCKESCGTTGQDRQTLIILGDAINITSFPWQAALYKQSLSGAADLVVQRGNASNATAPSPFKFICGGSLIRENLVLTAAHCVTNEKGELHPVDDFMVALGKTKSAWDAPEDTAAIKLKIYDIVAQRDYHGSSTSFANDIAVLVLQERADLNQYVTPVCLNWTPDGEVPLRAGNLGTVAGWGATEASTTSETLFAAEVAVVSRDSCYDVVDRAHHGYITPDKLCAGHERVPDGQVQNVAKGDSGGGLCFRDARGTWFVRGVVSVGLTKHALALYTDVNFFRDFLADVRDRVVIDEVRLKELVAQAQGH